MTLGMDPEIEEASKRWDVHFGGADFVNQVEEAFTAINNRIGYAESKIAEIEYQFMAYKKAGTVERVPTGGDVSYVPEKPKTKWTIKNFLKSTRLLMEAMGLPEERSYNLSEVPEHSTPSISS